MLAAFPQQDDWRKFGEAYVIFDTKLYPESSRPIEVVSCDVQFQGALPSWQFDNSLIRWLYVDPFAEYPSALRVMANRCYTPWNGSENPRKKLAGDGMSCGMDFEWVY